MSSYKFTVNGKEYSSDEKIIPGEKILSIANFLPVEDFDLLKKIKGHEFEPIQLQEKVNLEEPGIELFKVFPHKELPYTLDDEESSTKDLELTPVEILKIHGYNTDQYYLKQIKRPMEINYKNDLEVRIVMLDHPKFITCKKEPTTVSGAM
jgi:hypothetical protein